MPLELERKLKAAAKRRRLKGARADAYVYGTLRKTGWKPKRELKEAHDAAQIREKVAQIIARRPHAFGELDDALYNITTDRLELDPFELAGIPCPDPALELGAGDPDYDTAYEAASNILDPVAYEVILNHALKNLGLDSQLRVCRVSTRKRLGDATTKLLEP